jgi:molecular chaperone GrpE
MEDKNKITEEQKENAQKVGLDLTENTPEFVLEDNPIAHVSVLEEQLKDANDKYMRLFAEFDNYKKRVLKEKEDLVLNTKTKMLSAVLDMDSDITIAVKSIKNKEALKGVSLIAKKLETFLQSQGIESIQTETYDDELHEVISVIQPGGKEIVDVVTKGYSLNGKVFRYPKIVLGN